MAMMTNAFNGPMRDASLVTLSLLAWNFGMPSAEANPTGGSVTQGHATFNSVGSQFTINSTSANTVINWQSFNVGAGETTTFIEPSSSSVVWNHITDANPSQILGTINANGYVVLQNQNGFVVGGDAAIKAVGLVMTTSPTPTPNLASGGAWQFDAPPPASKIINYGQITVAGGPAYLIAADIENNGTISAPQGKIGLYAGKEVLVSTSPTGRGLSARVTLPQGSVDNEGKLIADGGTIAALAQTVKINGTAQANSVKNVNGVIELVASDSLQVGPQADIEANGDASSSGASPGGFVVLQAGNSYSDTASSKISVSGQNGGQDGIVEVLGNNFTPSIQSQIGSSFATLVNPYDITLSRDTTDTSSSNPTLNVTDLANYAQVDLHALDTIELTVSWALKDPSLSNPGAWGSLLLSAGNNIILDDSSAIRAANNNDVSLTAGTKYDPTSGQTPAAGTDSILLGDGQGTGGVIQSQNGDIHVWAARDVTIATVDFSSGLSSSPLSGAIRTQAGGSIDVTALTGDVNCGNDPYAYNFGLAAAPYYSVNLNRLGGISTGAGGNVSINAGGNVYSYLPTQNDYVNNSYVAYGGGAGAFGAQPGNVSITAGGSVFGNYVVANGTGVINATGNAGENTNPNNSLYADFALSLIKGSWTVNAQNIYLDDVLNPNGVFNDRSNGAHYFDYDAAASLTLNAVDHVEITGGGVSGTAGDVPLLPESSSTGLTIPVLLPPSLSVTAGAGGFTLDTDIVLFPSPNQGLNIDISNGGSFLGRQGSQPNNISIYNIVMSDSAHRQWDPSVGNSLATEIFGYNDHAPTPPELNNLNPVQIKVDGDMNYLNIYADKQATLKVNGNMFDSGFVGENLHAGDTTSITVGGNVSFSPVYSFVTLSQALPANWQSFFFQLVDPLAVAVGMTPAQAQDKNYVKSLMASVLVFPSATPNPGFVYDPATKQIGYAYQMSGLVRSALEGTLDGKSGTWEAIKLDSSGNPILQQGSDGKYYFATTTITPFISSSVVESLFNSSLGLAANSHAAVTDAQHLPIGFQIGGPGTLDVTVHGSLDLGATPGILSWGGADGTQTSQGINYASLDALTGNAGANINVRADGGLGMLTSTIASIGGGNVTVDSGGQINLGLGGLALNPLSSGNLAYGIYTAAMGDVKVTADGTINIDTARIGTFNGGDVYVESYNGDVNAGNGINMVLQVITYIYDSETGIGKNLVIQAPRPYGSGILAISPTHPYQVSPGDSKDGEQPGNITVVTKNGNIKSTLGGIAQFALNGNVAGGPTVNLTAGTPGVAATDSQGNIDLGDGGVIGGSVNLSAQGNVKGLVISRQNTTVTAVENVNVTVLAGGSANVSAGGTLSGTLVGVGGISASGGSISATMLSSSVSANGGAAQNSLGVATASAASQSAANQANNETKQEVANNNGDDDDKKKKPQTLLQRVKRVTVILPKT